MSEERIGDKFLRRLYEKTVNNGTENIDREEIGKEIGVLDAQMELLHRNEALSIENFKNL